MYTTPYLPFFSTDTVFLRIRAYNPSPSRLATLLHSLTLVFTRRMLHGNCLRPRSLSAHISCSPCKPRVPQTFFPRREIHARTPVHPTVSQVAAHRSFSRPRPALSRRYSRGENKTLAYFRLIATRDEYSAKSIPLFRLFPFLRGLWPRRNVTRASKLYS